MPIHAKNLLHWHITNPLASLPFPSGLTLWGSQSQSQMLRKQHTMVPMERATFSLGKAQKHGKAFLWSNTRVYKGLNGIYKS